MEKLIVKYSTYANAIPPRPIRVTTPGWGGTSEKMEDGADPQPWHCLPFVEASTYGLELIYQFETECRVVNDRGAVRFDWDFTKEPGGVLTGGEFVIFAPLHAARYYLFNTRLDVQAPPGHVLRTEPHPRFFTDDTGTVPLAMVGHFQSEWYPRLLFVVFKAPTPGQRHVFRKGEPFAQILFVPMRRLYELIRMDASEEAHRRELEHSIQDSRRAIGDHQWQNSDGPQMDNHYKVLARAFARDGVQAVEDIVQKAVERHEQSLPKDKSIEECLAHASQLMRDQKRREATGIYSHVLGRDPDNADALSHMGICLACAGNVPVGLQMMARAAALQPQVAKWHSNLGEIQRLLERFQDAEASFRSSLQLNPNDPGIWSVLGLTLAQQGRIAEGLEASRWAVTLGSSVPAVHFRLGLILSQQGQVGKARASLETALTLDPNYAEARRALEALNPSTQLETDQK